MHLKRPPLKRREAKFTYDEEADAYYFYPKKRSKGPYLTQHEARAVIDIADDGSLAGVEILGGGSLLPEPLK